MATTSKDVAQKKFLEWLKKNEPFLFDVAMQKHRSKVAREKSSGMGFLDLGSFNLADFVKTAADTIKTVAPQVVQIKAQSDLLKAQVKRAQAGQPPLDANAYLSTQPNAQAPFYQPSLVNYDQAAVAAAARAKPATNYLPWLAGGAGILTLAFLLKRRGA